ncbi:hypothetical protein SAMN05518801_10744 [Novosphingobium sp. CF614]|uniref:hypothetical protein n=1 Tax=Novosphingobium sp. CF614 TaxID=1884364 RepID=UPI0008E9D434|nr:hypothetical protein [Novosphingobium sp. CF614]SFG08567.1 hypothetical protein SAMN05518801_10744 [Novosphingobium sp. CF614]
MTRNWLRLAELIALVALGGGLLVLCGMMISQDKMGEAFGTALLAFGSIVQAIRNQSQAHAMNAMADHLAKSVPAREDAEERMP